MDDQERVSFSFGKNWQKYLKGVDEQAYVATERYLVDWLGQLDALTVLDVGSGSGIQSRVAFERGAIVTSFDLDPASVAATRSLWQDAGHPRSWTILEGSILDGTFTSGLGRFDIVMSWGVLHHTGRLWAALDAAANLVLPGGVLWIGLYHRTAQSQRSLRTKRFYNRLPAVVKPIFRGLYITAKILKHLVVRRNLDMLRDSRRERGMDWRRDVEDWLGGLPYEVSSPGEVLSRLRPRGFALERLADGVAEGGNDVYLFRRQQADS